MSRQYLGGYVINLILYSVYADISHRQLVLSTENGFGPSNEIFLKVEVIDALIGFLKTNNYVILGNEKE